MKKADLLRKCAERNDRGGKITTGWNHPAIIKNILHVVDDQTDDTNDAYDVYESSGFEFHEILPLEND
jgi:hypothetical protein